MLGEFEELKRNTDSMAFNLLPGLGLAYTI
jgi:hypothetical protein